MRTRSVIAAALIAAPLALAHAPAASAGITCWVEAQKPYLTQYGVYGHGTNECKPPSTVRSIRVEVQKRSGVWPFYTWARYAGGSTIYAAPGTLDMSSSATKPYWSCKSGTFRTYVYGTAFANAPLGATSSGAVSLKC